MSGTDTTKSLALGPGRGFGDGTARAWQGRDGRYHHMAGENSRGAKLTEAQVRDILTRPATGPGRHTNVALAREFAVGVSTIAAIRNRTSWRHVKVEGPA